MKQATDQNLNKADAARRLFLKRLSVLGVASVAAPAVLPALSRTNDDMSSLKRVSIKAPELTREQASEQASEPAPEQVSKQASSEHRWGLLIDTTKCATGCDACVRGCNKEHGIERTGNDHTDAQWIRKIDMQDNLTGQVSSLPMLCQHCDSAPCVDVCPTGASFKRADGVVLVNKHTCIGCRYCMLACPYKARSFIHEPITNQLSTAPRGQGTVESCTLCVHRIDADKDQQPACAEACTEEAHDAILFGDLNDPESDITKAMVKKNAQQVRSDLSLNTGVRYTLL